MSSRYHGQSKSDQFQAQGAKFEYALVVCVTQSAVAKAFTAFQSRAVCKIRRVDRLTPLYLDESKAQNGCVTTPHEQFIFFPEQSSRRRTACAARPASGSFFRHRLAPDVARQPAKRGVGPRPRREAPHPVVNLYPRPLPINATVFPFKLRPLPTFPL